MATKLEFEDIQGIVISAYSKLTCASYVPLRVDDAPKAKQWLAAMASEVTKAVKPTGDGPRTNMNLAITHGGLKKLGVPDDVLTTFSFPFIDGMASERRSRILGDTEASAPLNWQWGNDANPVDIILMLYAVDDGTIDSLETSQAGRAGASGMTVLATLRAGRQPDTKEHFGFNDGVGQPTIQGTDLIKGQKLRTQHATDLPPGEFLLSYEDAYGTVAPSPTVAASSDPQNLLPRHEDGRTCDLGRNGSYMVFRQLEQDVAGFWRFVDAAAGADPAARDRMGAKLVGRWRSGTPLVTAPDRDTWTGPDLNNFNDFNYSSDRNGYACPIGAHIRRTNPRDSLGTDHAASLVTANRHRLMRRGRSYGDRLGTEADPMPMADDGKKRGLHFICFNADLQRQFEFVQQTWVNNPQFGGLHDEVDPVIGDQSSCSGMFTIQADPLRARIKNLCAFVTMRGGAYAFLPGVRALKWIATWSAAAMPPPSGT
jgi:Dyp-type peroxidase family